ncbi:SDR family NAD(P)-dependent oxidoreductase [Rugosimonospora africana]|uniref:Carrier domain-containing protein n=1 Tax=Rugosimonospora africana TaxID=556532 RepID=A0A8J3VX20_9ACTN|nr:SDR family NAD(P)-dependent oxidoreductase [Rugosimonospora africana]GIH21403.1 hypothetical protein Raf01_95750 [Rugosimonospora africana]
MTTARMTDSGVHGLPDDGTALGAIVASVAAVPQIDRVVAQVRYEPVLERAGAPSATDSPTVEAHRADSNHPAEQRGETIASRRRPPAMSSGGDVKFGPGQPRTLQQAIVSAAQLAPTKGTTYIAEDGTESFQSYRDLLDESQRVLGGLRQTGLRPGDPVLFQFSDNRDFLTAFWACVLGGYLPTPLGAGSSYDREDAVTRKLRAAWELLDHPLTIGNRSVVTAIGDLAGRWGLADWHLVAVEDLIAAPKCDEWWRAEPDDPVLHLLTSGSTGVPKCVRHTNASVLALSRGTAIANGFDHHEVSINWMPLDHVGSLVMYAVRDVIYRCDQVNVATEAVLADPLLWMDLVHRFRVTNTWAPNFAFALVNDGAVRMKDREWDLSCLRHICNGGEAVVSQTAHKFLRLLKPYGLPTDAMRPCWGMSETCSGVTFSTLSGDDLGMGTLRVDKASLAGAVEFVPADRRDAAILTEVGLPIPGVALRIVDTDGDLLPEDHVGRLEVRGTTMTDGYFRNDDANRQAFTRDGWFRTGDLAFLHHGRLTITGREKDLIIIRGQNYLSYELESLVEQVPGTTVSFVAVSSYRPAGVDTDQLVVFFVPESQRRDRAHETISGIRSTLAREAGVQPNLVVPLPRDRFSKTGSGKIQRAQLVDSLRRGEFDQYLDDDDLIDGRGGAVPPWFFETRWRTETLSRAPTPPDPRRDVVVVFDDHDHALSDQLPAELAEPALLVLVRPAAQYGENSPTDIGVVPGNQTHYRRMFEKVTRELGPIGTVIHGWGLSERPGEEGDLPALLEVGTFSVVALAKAMASLPDLRAAVLILTTAGLRVTDTDPLTLAHGTLPGLVRTLVAEETLGAVGHVDLPAGAPGQWPAAIREWLAAERKPVVAAYRDSTWFVRRLHWLKAGSTGGATPPIVAGGLYVITGGLGGVGYEIAQYLLAAYQVRLLLVGRTSIVGGSTDEHDETVQRLNDLRSLGEVEYRSLDVADRTALRAAVTEAEHRFGQPLAGVFHLAAPEVSDHWNHPEAHTVVNETIDAFERLYRAKVYGTLALADVLTDRPDALLVLFSSVNAEFGGASFAAYASACSFLNAFAQYWTQVRARRVRCLSWSSWRGVGMNRDSPLIVSRSRGFLPISTSQGIASLLIGLSAERPEILIGLDPRNQQIIRDLAPEHLQAVEAVVAYTANGPVDADLLAAITADAQAKYPLPVRLVELAQIPVDESGAVDSQRLFANAVAADTRYAEPESDLERLLAAIWEDALGYLPVGRDDNFFEVGGTSMLASQAVNQINDAQSARISVRQLYENPTIGQLARCLAEALAP